MDSNSTDSEAEFDGSEQTESCCHNGVKRRVSNSSDSSVGKCTKRYTRRPKHRRRRPTRELLLHSDNDRDEEDSSDDSLTDSNTSSSVRSKIVSRSKYKSTSSNESESGLEDLPRAPINDGFDVFSQSSHDAGDEHLSTVSAGEDFATESETNPAAVDTEAEDQNLMSLEADSSNSNSSEELDSSEDCSENGRSSSDCHESDDEENYSEIEVACKKQVLEYNEQANSYKDITDGSLYKNYYKKIHSENENGTCHHLRLMISTDGAPVFKSVHCSIWPLYLCILELPLEKRLLVRLSSS
ncbi:hypothetical protein OS493_035355 [Desmophyllum pertusum]|uniref:Uncharacterized protein n=1 Tax=Desmophyllum pertusum TaxID=174260 RepID=A0A9W9Y7L4_9CNID|nr:hypothetical protein OS493_035355 [Desmophyllum pertusum]